MRKSSTYPSDNLAFHVNDAAKIGGVSRSELYKAMKTGGLRAKKHGRRTIILKDDLAAFLSSLPDYTPEAA